MTTIESVAVIAIVVGGVLARAQQQGGLSAADKTTLNVVTSDTSANRVDIRDAVRLVRCAELTVAACRQNGRNC